MLYATGERACRVHAALSTHSHCKALQIGKLQQEQQEQLHQLCLQRAEFDITSCCQLGQVHLHVPHHDTSSALHTHSTNPLTSSISPLCSCTALDSNQRAASGRVATSKDTASPSQPQLMSQQQHKRHHHKAHMHPTHPAPAGLHPPLPLPLAPLLVFRSEGGGHG